MENVCWTIIAQEWLSFLPERLAALHLLAARLDIPATAAGKQPNNGIAFFGVCFEINGIGFGVEYHRNFFRVGPPDSK